jgi:TRAP-type uncharacterized transport system substrate-binding protein
MSDDWAEIDVITDATGKRVSIGHAGGLVRHAIVDATGIVLQSVTYGPDELIRFRMAHNVAQMAAEAVSGHA